MIVKKLGLINKSKCVSPTTYAPVDTFSKEVISDVNAFVSQLDYFDHRPNRLSSKEKLSLKELKQNDEIVLKPADNGGSIAIMDRQMYEKEIDRQIEDEEVFKK